MLLLIYLFPSMVFNLKFAIEWLEDKGIAEGVRQLHDHIVSIAPVSTQPAVSHRACMEAV